MDSCVRGCIAYRGIARDSGGEIQTSANLSLLEIQAVQGGGFIYDFTVPNFTASSNVLYYVIVLDEATNRTAFLRIVCIV